MSKRFVGFDVIRCFCWSTWIPVSSTFVEVCEIYCDYLWLVWFSTISLIFSETLSECVILCHCGRFCLIWIAFVPLCAILFDFVSILSDFVWICLDFVIFRVILFHVLWLLMTLRELTQFCWEFVQRGVIMCDVILKRFKRFDVIQLDFLWYFFCHFVWFRFSAISHERGVLLRDILSFCWDFVSFCVFLSDLVCFIGCSMLILSY